MTTTLPEQRLITENELAEYLTVARSTVRAWRQKKTGPKSIALNGGTTIRYRWSDVKEWENGCG